MSLVCCALRKYTEGKALVYPLIGHGLQIYKNSGIIHFELVSSEEKATFHCEQLWNMPIILTEYSTHTGTDIS